MARGVMSSLQAAADALGELEDSNERLSKAQQVNAAQEEEVTPLHTRRSFWSMLLVDRVVYRWGPLVL